MPLHLVERGVGTIAQPSAIPAARSTALSTWAATMIGGRGFLAGCGRMVMFSNCQCRPLCVTLSSVHSRLMISMPSVKPRHPILHRDTEHGEFLGPVAEADAEIELAAGDHVEEGADLGQLHRIVQRQQHDVGAKFEALGFRR